MSVWLMFAALGALAVACLLIPAWRYDAGREANGDARADQLRRLDELDEDLSAGDIDDATAPAVRAELERAVFDAVSVAASPRRAAGRRLPLLAALLTPLLAAWIYASLGEPGIARLAANDPSLDLAAPEVAVEILLERVRERVADAPHDRDAWMVLARTTLQLGRYDEALAAAEQVVQLAPDDVGGLLLLIDAVAMHASGALVPRAVQLLEHVLELESGNISALILQGIAHEQAGDTQSAAAHWQRALDALPAGAPMRVELAGMLASVGAQPPAEPPPAKAPTVSVTAQVTITPALRDAVAGSTPVFIFARAQDGPAAPLAVVRHTVSELPLAVTLDDGMAMMPGVSLADFDPVYLVARVSLSGQPRASRGDYEGRSAPFAPRADSTVALEIDTVVP